MDSVEEEKKEQKEYIYLYEDGRVLCVNEETNKVEKLPLDQVNIDNLFSFTTVDNEKLKEYIKEFAEFEEESPFHNMDVDKEFSNLTALEVIIHEVDEDTYELEFC